MAADKTNNLTIFLTEIADAIREVYNITDAINPQDFASYIKNIPNQGGNSSGNTSGTTSGNTDPIELTTTVWGDYHRRVSDDISLGLIDFYEANKSYDSSNSGYQVPADKLKGKYTVDGYELTNLQYIPSYPNFLLFETSNDYGDYEMPLKLIIYKEDSGTAGYGSRGTILILT